MLNCSRLRHPVEEAGSITSQMAAE